MGALVRRISTSSNIHASRKPSSRSAGLAEQEEGEFHDPRAVHDEFRTETVGLTSARAAELLALHGHNELPEKVVPKWLIFVSLLWQPMPVSLSVTAFIYPILPSSHRLVPSNVQLMIWVAIIIEAAILNWVDMGILLFIQFGNASIGYYETAKVRITLRPPSILLDC